MIGFLLFYVAELINFSLGLVYQMNFLNAVTRRWKSLSQLSHLSLKPRVDCMIFHYTEEVAVTKKTLDGALKMQTNQGKSIGLNIYVCDDGFWKKCEQPAGQHPPLCRRHSRPHLIAASLALCHALSLPLSCPPSLTLSHLAHTHTHSRSFARTSYRVWAHSLSVFQLHKQAHTSPRGH